MEAKDSNTYRLMHFLGDCVRGKMMKSIKYGAMEKVEGVAILGDFNPMVLIIEATSNFVFEELVEIA